jgi:hypothetical protein
MDDAALHMETRVRKLEDVVKTLEVKLERLHVTLNDALLGTLDGRPGIVQTLHHSLEASRINSGKLDVLTAQVDALRLDKAKVTGIVVVVSVLWGAFLVVLKYAF